MKINNYSKVLTYLIILSVIYCVFMVTYSFSKSDNSTILNNYIDIVKVQDENIARLYKKISKLGIEILSVET